MGAMEDLKYFDTTSIKSIAVQEVTLSTRRNNLLKTPAANFELSGHTVSMLLIIPHPLQYFCVLVSYIY